MDPRRGLQPSAAGASRKFPGGSCSQPEAGGRSRDACHAFAAPSAACRDLLDWFVCLFVACCLLVASIV